MQSEQVPNQRQKKSRSSRRPNEARLRRITTRQVNQTWDRAYVPAILAVRGEAPSASHALTITPEKLDGRDVHLLSLAECSAAILGLYHPDVVGLQEQRVFSRGASPHPLHNFRLASPVGLQPFSGMIDVADRLGYVGMLPKVKVNDPSADVGYRLIVFPYVGDLLWAMRAKDGHYYCINWSVKDSEDAFKRPLECKRFVTPAGKMAEGILARHELESVYYRDAGIRTVFLAAESIDPHVCANLRMLFLHHRRKVNLCADAQEDLIGRFRHCLDSGIPTSELIFKLVGAGKYDLDDCRNLLYQAIWFRKLRVDLLQPIVINRPLRPETQDVIELYADWFKEVLPC